MKSVALFCFTFILAATVARAEVPPAQNLLPDDTLFVFTVPSVAKARAAYAQSPQVQLWNDPAMKPFREKFMAKWATDVIEPLERELNIKVADYQELAQGQFTLAVIRNGWTGGSNPEPALVLLLDSSSKSEQLARNLADLRKKWTDSGKQVRTEKIRDTEFSVLALSANDLRAPFKKALGGTNSAPEEAWPGADDEAKARLNKKEEVFVGQTGSVLLIGDKIPVLEKVLSRLAGGSVPTLGEQAGFETAHNRLFRDTAAFGWLDAKGLIAALSAQAAKEEEEDADALSFFPSLNKLLPALGINSLKTAAISVRVEEDGTLLHFFLGAPASERTGVFKILAIEEKDATPPPFVPADATKFRRIRANLPKAWSEIESMFDKVLPGQAKALEDAMKQIGKEKDPNFDFRKTLHASLGDDIITYQKPPKGTSPAELSSAPSLTLLGSPNADQLLLAFKALTSILPPPIGGSEIKEREFLGRKIYSLTAPQEGTAGQASRGMHFAISGGYLAISADPAMVEEFIRSAESQPKALRDRPGLLDAAQKIGGPGTGVLGFADQAESMRVTFAALRQNKESSVGMSFMPANPMDIAREWFDASLLPEFSQIAKYFFITVHAGSANEDGLSLKFYSPRPPELKK